MTHVQQTITPTSLVRRYLPQLARLVHPDFFSANPQAQATNLASLQSLNALISSAFPSTPSPTSRLHTNIPPSTAVKFYCRTAKSDKEATKGLSLISHTLTAAKPPTPRPTSHKRALEQAHLASSFLSLCTKAGVTVTPQDTESLTALLNPTSPFRRRLKNKPTLPDHNAARIEFQSTLRSTLSQIDQQGLSSKSSPFGSEHLDEHQIQQEIQTFRLPSLILFARSLSPSQREHAEMELKRYFITGGDKTVGREIPVIVVASNALQVDQEAVLVVACDWSQDKLKNYLYEALPRAQAEMREKMKTRTSKIGV
ncbi:hypothetical protein HDV00_012251 [Rhizophlyctis rosea]|nr:hypothetical protein HDV00_012251 [Rhizophlyctis rosea]